MPAQVVVGELQLGHEDDRRRIDELVGADFSVQSFMIKQSGLPLGNHFHREMNETFVIFEGGGELFIAPVDSDGTPGEVAHHELRAGSVVRIPAFNAHTFRLEPGTKMLCVIDRPFDAVDLHRCIII